MIVNLAGIVHESITDGPGLRVTLFFQGCPHHCPGCHNPHTWDPQDGKTHHVQELCAQLQLTPLVKGLTLSGGEPFMQPAAAAAIAGFFKNKGKDVWTYTGYLWEKLLENPDPQVQSLINLSDIIVDGPFIQDLRDPQLAFRGSSNQRIIDVKNSLQQAEVIEWQPAEDPVF